VTPAGARSDPDSPDPAVVAEIERDIGEYLAEQGPSVDEAVEGLQRAVERAADQARVQARAEVQMELTTERRLRLEAEARAAAVPAPSDTPIEFVLDFQRGRDGKIASPMVISGTDGASFP
jgi:hypothetical protein